MLIPTDSHEEKAPLIGQDPELFSIHLRSCRRGSLLRDLRFQATRHIERSQNFAVRLHFIEKADLALKSLILFSMPGTEFSMFECIGAGHFR